MYDIGDYVMVSAKMGRGGTYPQVIWRSFKMGKEILGCIVGKKVVYDGRVEQPAYDYFESNPAYFVPSKTRVFWLVRFGLRNKPIIVADDGIRLAKTDEVADLPELYRQQYAWTKKERRAMSEDSKHWPRDEKGRWLAG